MILQDTVIIKMAGRSASYYKSIGYDGKWMEEVEILVKDLSQNSHAKILVRCDICNKEIIKEYRALLKERNNHPLDCCAECSSKKAKISNMQKYGVTNVMYVEEYRDNLKNTMLEKYGVENISSLPENKEKVKATIREKYGVDSYTQTQECKDKKKITNLKKYGVEHYVHTEEYKEKSVATCIGRYGVAFPTKNPEIVAKIKKTCLEKYGVDNYFKSDIFKNNLKDFNLEEYGVAHFSQTEVFKNKTKNTWENKTKEEICKIKQKANATMSLNGTCKTSTQQRYIYDLLKETFDVALNYPEGNFSFDIMLKSKDVKIDIEYDGWYWHKDRGQQDFIRDCINKRKGYKILRIKSKEFLPDKNELLSCIDELLNTDICFKELKMSDWKEGGE